MKTPFKILTTSILSLTVASQLTAQEAVIEEAPFTFPKLIEKELKPVTISDEELSRLGIKRNTFVMQPRLTQLLIKKAAERGDIELPLNMPSDKLRLVLKRELKLNPVGIHEHEHWEKSPIEQHQLDSQYFYQYEGMHSSKAAHFLASEVIGRSVKPTEEAIEKGGVDEETYLDYRAAASWVLDNQEGILLSEKGVQNDFDGRAAVASVLATDELTSSQKVAALVTLATLDEAALMAGFSDKEQANLKKLMKKYAADEGLGSMAEITLEEQFDLVVGHSSRVDSVTQDVQAMFDELGSIGTFDVTFTTPEGVEVTRSYELTDDGVSKTSDNGETKDLINLRERK